MKPVKIAHRAKSENRNVLMTFTQAAEDLGCSTTKIYRIVDQEPQLVIQIGKMKSIRRKEWEAWRERENI